jgi:uncharacterized damage-inducible protein DinB
MEMVERDILEIPNGYRSDEAGSFMAQLDDQSRLLLRDLADITPEELEWQPSPGMNTIGMLLAHIAIVEVFWTEIGVLGKPAYDIGGVLGIGVDDDGMPIPAGGPPAANLAGKRLAFYQDLLQRARVVTKKAASALAPDNLLQVRSRTRRNGQMEEFNVRWVLYHLLEHFAGHFGQILLLRHQYRAARNAPSTKPLSRA